MHHVSRFTAYQVSRSVPRGNLRSGRGGGRAGAAGQGHEVLRAACRAHHSGGRGAMDVFWTFSERSDGGVGGVVAAVVMAVMIELVALRVLQAETGWRKMQQSRGFALQLPICAALMVSAKRSLCLGEYFMKIGAVLVFAPTGLIVARVQFCPFKRSCGAMGHLFFSSRSVSSQPWRAIWVFSLCLFSSGQRTEGSRRIPRSEPTPCSFRLFFHGRLGSPLCLVVVFSLHGYAHTILESNSV